MKKKINKWALCMASTVAVLTVPTESFAKCVITNPAAQLCQSGTGAAVAFVRSTSDKPLDDAMAKLLLQSGCKVVGKDAANMTVREIARGQIHISEGNIAVVSVLIDRTSYWYVAASNVEGVCDPV